MSEHAAYPIYQHMRVSPLYRNPDGTWPKAPEGHKAGEEVQITGFGTFSVRERKVRPVKSRADDQGAKTAGRNHGTATPPLGAAEIVDVD